MATKVAQTKMARRLGLAHTPKASKVLESRPNPPGQHGGRPSRRVSDYKLQLVEKQRLRMQYNLSEHQLRLYYKKANRKLGNTPDNLIQALETRLDAAVVRAGLSRTIYSARQFVNHGHVKVNGKKVDIPSYGLKVNDVIEVKDKSKKLDVVVNAMENPTTPEYLELDTKKCTVTLLYVPKREEIPVVCELPRVIEFYSK